FQFALRVPRRIACDLRLAAQNPGPLQAFFSAVGELGPALGPLHLQLPADQPIDLKLLHDFLRAVPRGPRLAFELRHHSWRAPGTLRLLSAYEAALVVSDAGEGPPRMELT